MKRVKSTLVNHSFQGSEDSYSYVFLNLLRYSRKEKNKVVDKTFGYKAIL